MSGSHLPNDPCSAEFQRPSIVMNSARSRTLEKLMAGSCNPQWISTADKFQERNQNWAAAPPDAHAYAKLLPARMQLGQGGSEGDGASYIRERTGGALAN